MPAEPLLAKALAELDAALDAKIAKTLRKPASKAALAKLKKTGALTKDLETWFAWHDGQSGTSSIGPSANDRLLDAAAAADAWAFLEKEGNKPWKSSWLPVLENGAGDYVVVDRVNGRLLRYYHDEKARPKEAPSLAAWAAAVAKEWRAASASKQKPAATPGWTPAEPPSSKELKAAPDGTAYHYRKERPTLGKGVFTTLVWKKAKGMWFQATNSTLEKAWTSISNNQLPFQAWDDGRAGYEIDEAPEGELLVGRFPEIPR